MGKKSLYPKVYNKNLLEKISRKEQRDAMGINNNLVLMGVDMWNCYELSWLNNLGKPMRACVSLVIPASSPNLVESKSIKLYLNSLNYKKFLNAQEVCELIRKDISEYCDYKIKVILNSPDLKNIIHEQDNYFCLDKLDIKINKYQKDKNLLKLSRNKIKEKVVTHVFKSHCLCTGQPDWGSIFISYTGPEIIRESLLAYLISYSDHQGFSENCIEQIYADILNLTNPEKLCVFGRFTRRGGIDINPYRSNYETDLENTRLCFQ